MLADLDLLLTAVYCTADDLLPQKPRNWRRQLTDAEVVALCVAQVMLGQPSDRRFLRACKRQLRHLFPVLPSQSGLHKRRAKLADTIAWLVEIFATQSPAAHDAVVVVDSTPVECGRSLETARRSQLADVAGYGYSQSHSRWFWGMRLHLACSLDGTPRAIMLCGADQKERDVALRQLLPVAATSGATTAICDKGYTGSDFTTAAARLGITIIRPRRRDEGGHHPHLAPIRQRIESVFHTCKDILTLERHGARTVQNLKARIGLRLLALAAAIWLNHQYHRPSRALADLTA
jgi:transposase